jgi:hypothetical protein
MSRARSIQAHSCVYHTLFPTIIAVIWFQASSVERDYLKHGFVAGAKEQEIACADYEVLLMMMLMLMPMLMLILMLMLTFIVDASSALIAFRQVWITRSCIDVTDQLSDALAESDALSRANMLRVRRQDIARQAEEAAATADGGCRCEVQEMWADKSYVRPITCSAESWSLIARFCLLTNAYATCASSTSLPSL